jgi:hypothetical protein
MKAVKIRLRPSINHMWDGDEVTFLTTTPQDTLNEWLTKYYEPLENFRFFNC